MKSILTLEDALKKIEELEKENAKLKDELEYYKNKKINNMLKELEQQGLIYRRHQGLGRPNEIYVYNLLKPDNSNWIPKKFLTERGWK